MQRSINAPGIFPRLFSLERRVANRRSRRAGTLFPPINSCLPHAPPAGVGSLALALVAGAVPGHMEPLVSSHGRARPGHPCLLACFPPPHAGEGREGEGVDARDNPRIKSGDGHDAGEVIRFDRNPQ